tara:strand:+ start:647 stop:778 length:132 start_codon:yes stop_codon:yes gene_type:complete
MDWYKGLSEQEIKMYKQMREEQQKAKKKGVTGKIKLILKNLKD